jgi:hypothetical protein
LGVAQLILEIASIPSLDFLHHHLRHFVVSAMVLFLQW